MDTPTETSSTNNDSSNNVEDPSQFIFTEFFYNMLPCYYFIVMFFVRYFKIKDLPVETTDLNENTLRSFFIKTRLSYFVGLTYILSVLFSLTLSPNVYFGANFRGLAILYLLGAASWFMSGYLLEV